MATTKKEEEQNQLEVQDVSSQNTSQQTGSGYQSQWQSQINDQVNQYLNRDKFQYDVNADALYQQMKDMYVMQGRQAMMDTMGQSAAMTGGYGNSWAQGAGQQAYQGYIQQLNDSIPDLYQMALDQYINEGDQMAQNIGLMMDMESTDYDRYWDQMADQDAEYEKLLTLMTKYKYEPTAEEMAAAGMTESQMNAILGKNKKSSGGTGLKEPIDYDYNSVREDVIAAKKAGRSHSEIQEMINAAYNDGYITSEQRMGLSSTYNRGR